MDYINLFKEGNKIHIKPENKGKFTEASNKAGKSVWEYAHDIVSNPNSSEKQRKRALFAINAKKWKHSQGEYFKYYLPKAEEGVKADTIQNTNLFLNITQKELNKKNVETTEDKKYDLDTLLSSGAMPIFTMIYNSLKSQNNQSIKGWLKKPIPEKQYENMRPL